MFHIKYNNFFPFYASIFLCANSEEIIFCKHELNPDEIIIHLYTPEDYKVIFALLCCGRKRSKVQKFVNILFKK